MRRFKIVKILMFLVVILLLNSNLQGQDKNKNSSSIQGTVTVKIGQKMPDIEFNHMVNYPRGKAKLSDFKGKPVILDLWHTHCTACIQGFPKMQELQKKFGDKVQIIALTFDDLTAFNKLRKASPLVASINNLPFALGFLNPGDQDPPFGALKSFVDFFDLGSGFSVHVWIDKEGILKAVTASSNATEKNIQAFIDKQLPEFPENTDQRRRISPLIEKSLLLDSSVLKKLNYSAVFAKGASTNKYSQNYNGGLNSSEANQIAGKSKGLRMQKAGLIEFVHSTWWNITQKSLNIVFESEGLKKYQPCPVNNEDYNKWKVENTYVYELNLPNAVERATLFTYAREDVQRFFNVSITRETRMTPCLELYRIDQKDRITTKGLRKTEMLETYSGYDFYNYPMTDFVEFLQLRLDSNLGGTFITIVDKTGHKNIDLSLKNKLIDLKELERDLKEYGIGIREGMANLDCLVIRNQE